MSVAHGPDCPCPRCRGFERGNAIGPRFDARNELSLKHGAYAEVKLGPRVAELAAVIRVDVRGYRPGDEWLIQAMALVLARIEAAAAALGSGDAAAGSRLEADLRGWVNTLRRFANDLGLSPTSRARLHLDVAQTRRALTLADLAAEAARDDAVEAGADTPVDAEEAGS